VLPAITDAESDLDELLRRVAAAGVRHLFSQVLFLRSPTREKYLRWVAAEFPRYLEAYRNAYQGRVYLGGRYRERIRETIARLKAKHGFADGSDDEDAPARAAEQLRLW
jgi:DNA repair photolyase